MISFYLNNLLKDPVSQDSHILRYWAWGLRRTDLRGTQWSLQVESIQRLLPFELFWVHVAEAKWDVMPTRSCFHLGTGGCTALSGGQTLGTKGKALMRVLWGQLASDSPSFLIEQPWGRREEPRAGLCWSECPVPALRNWVSQGKPCNSLCLSFLSCRSDGILVAARTEWGLKGIGRGSRSSLTPEGHSDIWADPWC